MAVSAAPLPRGLDNGHRMLQVRRGEQSEETKDPHGEGFCAVHRPAARAALETWRHGCFTAFGGGRFMNVCVLLTGAPRTLRQRHLKVSVTVRVVLADYASGGVRHSGSKVPSRASLSRLPPRGRKAVK